MRQGPYPPRAATSGARSDSPSVGLYWPHRPAGTALPRSPSSRAATAYCSNAERPRRESRHRCSRSDPSAPSEARLERVVVRAARTPLRAVRRRTSRTIGCRARRCRRSSQFLRSSETALEYLAQALVDGLACTEDAGSHRPDGALHRRGDLLVAQSLELAQDD